MSEVKDRKKSPNLDLRGAEGNYVIGEFVGRFENKNYPGKFSSLIKVEETNGNTTLWDKEKEAEVEVDIESGDSVFIKESTWLASIFEKMQKGDRFRLEYTGTQKSKVKGRKAAFTYKCEPWNEVL